MGKICLHMFKNFLLKCKFCPFATKPQSIPDKRFNNEFPNSSTLKKKQGAPKAQIMAQMDE